jgi:nucleotide-binding universal stress UspA family protein
MAKTQTTRSKGRTIAPASNSKPRSSRCVFANILCAVDGTRSGMAAVRMAASLAVPDGHLTLLTVTAESSAGGLNANAAISPSRVEGILRRAKRIADDLGVASSSEVDHMGPPVKILLERAQDHDLLAIGAPPTSWLGGMLVGGVAAAALSQFTTPMLVVRRTFTGTLQGRQILVASDGEKGSDQIVELAGRLGVTLGARVTLVNALGPESKGNPRSIQAQARALERMLGDTSDVLIEPGKPWDVIIDAAKSRKAAIAVVGSRRLSGLRALGSVSRRVAHDAPCSVLLLPPPTKK